MVKARVMSGHAIHGKAKTQAPWNVGFRINDGGRVVAGFGYKGFDQRAQECVPRPLQDGLGGSVLGGDLTHERHGGSCGRHADLVWFGLAVGLFLLLYFMRPWWTSAVLCGCGVFRVSCCFLFHFREVW